MEFPGPESIDAVLEPVDLPRFVDVRYEPDAAELSDVTGATRSAVEQLPLSAAPAGGRIAVALGSRGIADAVPVARTVVETLRERGFDPVVVPAMGSHGGATADGQRRTLAGLGLDEETLGCPIDASMDTTVVGETASGDPVHVASAALAADGIVVVNRVKPHTNFHGEVESGLCKMAIVGLGKRPGATVLHERALVDGYVTAIRELFAVVTEQTPLLGGVAVLENFYDRTAAVQGVPASDLPDGEAPLLERARAALPTLPYDDLDLLVVERIGKDVSGTGMDTNVVGRYRLLNAPESTDLDVTRIVVLGLTEATQGNANGIGLADLTTADVAAAVDFEKLYANALTSNSLQRAALPVVMPDDQRALTAALSTLGPYDPETVRIAWIRDTGHLSSFRVSPALVDPAPDGVQVVGRSRLTFEDGVATFQAVEADEQASDPGDTSAPDESP
jgi:hypothetical protein